MVGDGKIIPLPDLDLLSGASGVGYRRLCLQIRRNELEQEAEYLLDVA
jgi:hypothetical protein